ncbi:MAG: SDR family oxidoreductase [Nitrospirae bacterium]|nr:MAG: SDR family oxidoreductase [Nitrospirota bacterium]
MNRLSHKTAIVTGGNRGIGKAIVRQFAHEGARVVIAARHKGLCEQVAAEIQAKGAEALAVPTDVTSEQQVEHLFEQAVQRFGQIDILVNNAGVFRGQTVVETDTGSFDQVIKTNLYGTFFCCRAGMRYMKQQGGGVIINMSSVAGIDGWAGTGAYSASKHGVMGLTKALADEGRPYGIKVCAICPGRVAHELVDASVEERIRSEAIDPYDVAETAIYLATLGPNAIVHRLIVDRLWADW